MSLALVAHYLGPTLGIGQYLDRLLPCVIEELNNKNVETIILGSPNAVEKTSALKNLTDKTSILPPLDYSPIKRLLWFSLYFNSYCHQKGIKHIVWLSNPIILPWHLPSIGVIHDVNEWKMENKYGYLKTALRSLVYLDTSLNCAKQIIAVSQTTYNDILNFRPNSQLEEKLITIPNGANSSLMNLPPVKIKTPKNPFLLSVGRIDPYSKNLPQAVNLTKALREISGENWELHLIGGMNNSTKKEGESFLKSIEKNDWVKYHGYLDNKYLAQWYREASAIVFLSNNEGFGFPIAEAASFNKWSIVSSENQAAFEAGGNSLIPININDSKNSASKVLQKLKQEQPQQIQLQTWETSAKSYAKMIQNLAINY